MAATVSGDAAFEPVRFDLQFVVELVGGAVFLGIDRLGPRLEAAVADLAAAQIAAIEPQGLARQPGEEGAIVTDDDERARKARQPVLEPFDRGEIEMVSRLIEQQYVGILRPRARDRGAAAPTARSAERRVGKESVSTGSDLGAGY